MLSSDTGIEDKEGEGTPRKSPRQSPRLVAQIQPEQINPLEKIEQLLTCSICLDRYKNPKLLPCQHTYCLPCLDNYADTAHHNLKCPECRSEHSIPYEGAKGFPTNLTLTGFLDIHLEATDDSSEQIEAYITRLVGGTLIRSTLMILDITWRGVEFVMKRLNWRHVTTAIEEPARNVGMRIWRC